MTVKMTNEPCACCGNPLATTNTNPDRLCGPCQRYMKPGSARYKSWKAAGKPSKRAVLESDPIRRQIRSNTRAQNGRKLPDPSTLPVEYLLACYREVKRRAERVEREAALLKGFQGRG